MKKVFKSLVLGAVCFFAVVVAGCKAPSSGGSSSGQGNQSLQKVDSVTKDTVADYIRNLTESGTVKITGDIDGSTFSEIKSALDDLFNSDQSIKIKLDMSGLTGVDTIGQNSFDGCLNLESVIIPDGVKNIGDSAFAGCTNLKNVQVPESVECVGVNAFKDCENLTDIDYKGFQTQWDEVTLGGNWNSGCPDSMKINYALITKDNVAEYIKSMKQSGTVKITGEMDEEIFSKIKSALSDLYKKTNSVYVDLDMTSTFGLKKISRFYMCYNLRSMVIPSSVEYIDSELFISSRYFSSISVDTLNENYSSVDGVLYSKDLKQLLFFPCGKRQYSFTVPDGVETIAHGAFRECKQLDRITIPNTVKKIEEYAFYMCWELNYVKLPDDLNEIAASMFDACGDLKDLLIPKTVKVIGKNAFSGCKKLKTINYTGSEQEWNSIQKGDSWNDGCPSDMIINFNYTGN